MISTTYTICFRHASSAHVLLETSLPELPQIGDWVRLANVGYEVVRREWLLPWAEHPAFEVFLQPLPIAVSQQHFRYAPMAEQMITTATTTEAPVYKIDSPLPPP